MIVLALAGLGVPPGHFPVEKAALAVVLSILSWAIPYARLGFPVYRAAFYPLTVLVNALIAAWSFIFTLSGRSTWKERCIQRPKIRFL